MREKHVEQQLVQAVKRREGKAYKWVSPGNNGVPDRLVLLPGGRVGMVEVKQPNGTIRPIQALRHKELERLGHKVWIVDHPNQIESTLNEIQTTPLPTTHDQLPGKES